MKSGPRTEELTQREKKKGEREGKKMKTKREKIRW